MGRGCPPTHCGRGLGMGPFPSSDFFFILGSRNAYFGAFSGPSECLLLHCNSLRPGPDLQYACPV